MSTHTELLDRFHAVLVEEIRADRPDLLTSPFTVAEIYQELVPYRTHRDRIGVEMNGDYEHLLMRLLAGEGGYLVLEADTAREELRSELASPNPNTGLFREFAAADVSLNPERVPAEGGHAGWKGEDRGGEDASPPGDAVAVESLAPSEPRPVPGPTAEPFDEGEPEAPTAPTAEGATQDPVEEPMASTEPMDEEQAACAWCRGTLPNRENLNYCPFCGTDVHVVPCPSCGEALEPDWRFCIACGAGVASG